jgi:carbon-monoxide dehydrogenase medium subunit
MLIALGARVRIRSVSGEREESLETFLVSGYQTTLEPGELVTDVLVPPPTAGRRMRYLKFTTRSAEDRPCVGVAISLGLDGTACSDLRLVVGAVSSTPVRVASGEGLAAGKPLTSDLVDEIAVRAAAAVDPIGDVRGSPGYKRRLVQVLVRRTLFEILGEVSA